MELKPPTGRVQVPSLTPLIKLTQRKAIMDVSEKVALTGCIGVGILWLVSICLTLYLVYAAAVWLLAQAS